MIRQICASLFVLFLLTGCIETRPGAIGDPSEILVFADREILWETEEVLKSVLEKEIITPQPETVFHVKKMNPLNLELYKKHRHLILMGIFNSDGICSRKINEILDVSILKSMKEGKYFYYVERDKDAYGQIRMFLMANNADELKEKIHKKSGFIFYQFDNALNKSSAKIMFSKMENVELEKELYEKYGWTMRMQPDYRIVKEDSLNGFILLRRLFKPDRMIGVHWKTSADGKEINENWVVETRKFLGKTYMFNMELNDEYTKFERVIFSGRDALKVEGLWEKNDKDIGGFFRSYVFFDQKTKRVYFVDISTFAPGKEKMPFIRQLDVIAHTFRTESLKPYKKNILGL
ncbi:DUF4837 family protein [bacterium]|nr:DUF4837 family protein [bacterium]